mgnify:FL=1
MKLSKTIFTLSIFLTPMLSVAQTGQESIHEKFEETTTSTQNSHLFEKEVTVGHEKGHIEIETTIGQAKGRVEGDSLSLSKVKAVVHWRYSDLLSFGPSLAIYQSNQSIDLFDRYLGAEFGADLVLQQPFGQLTPFTRANVVLASTFQAEGFIRRSITNGTENDQGLIEFPQPNGSVIGTSESRVDYFGYELKGRTLGAEIAVGAKYSVSDKLTFIGELGYSIKSMVINEAKEGNYGMTGGAEYAYDQRHGLNATGKDINEGFNVDIDRKSRYFPSLFLSVGLTYEFEVVKIGY